jgi:6,7-dimethyl-8-ribityllumazine synthase
MLEAATRTLKRGKAAEVRIVRVPGAFEVPAVVAKLLRGEHVFEGVICLGVILRGQTSHAQQIGDAVSASLAQLQVQHAVPVIHEVLLLENEEQAKARCLGTKHNRGAEAAQTALEMVQVMRGL